MPKLQDFSLTWLAVILTLLCLWCGDCTAAPIPLTDPSEPSRDLIDSASQKDGAWESIEKCKIIKLGRNVYNCTEKISSIKRRAGIHITGVLDSETNKLFVIPRCGNIEVEDKPTLHAVRLRRNRGSYLDHVCNHLREMINQTLQQLQTNNVPPAVQKKILTIMLNQWFNAMPQAALCRQRRLTDQGKKNADRLVCYVKRQHGDQFPIDGVGETLGSVFNSSGNTNEPVMSKTNTAPPTTRSDSIHPGS